MKLLSSLLLSLFVAIAFAKDPINIASKIDQVTVFLNGAQVTRTAKAPIPLGVSTLYFNEITQFMDPNSIQLTGKGRLTILSISHKRNYLKPDDKSETILSLENQIDGLQLKLAQNNAQVEALSSERELLKSNQKIGGQNGTSLSQLQQTATYYRKRLQEISFAQLELNQKKKDFSQKLKKLQLQLNEERSAYAQKTSRVIVKVDASVATNATFELTYVVSNAYWNTNYDARVESLSKPIKLTQKATISQNTGEDWSNVKLTLSTGNPSLGGQVPYMGPWYLDFYKAYNGNVRGARADGTLNIVGGVKMGGVASDANTRALEEAEFSPQQFSINQNLTQEEYVVDRRQNIASSGSAETVVLRDIELPAKYEYHIKPRLDKDAFLVAKVYDWDEFDLLSGDLSLFNQDTYVGKAYLNTQNPLDTLELSLGRDNDIIVSRKRVRDKEEKNFLGNYKTELYTWKIEVRNTKKSGVAILMKEPIPLSKNQDIKVTIDELSGGKLEEKSKIVRWRFGLAPGQKASFKVAYEVKYPKDKRVNLY